MQLTDFLNHHGITLDQIIAQIKTTLNLTPDDSLFVSGSVVEGLGNEKSDLDLFLVTSRQDIPLTSLDAVLLITGRCPVDVRVVQRSEVEQLLNRFNAWAKQARCPRNATGFSPDERKLLHQIRSGQAVCGAEYFRQLQDGIQLTDLVRHRLDCAQYLASTIQVDLAGLRSAGDQHSMLFAAQELLGLTVDALLAAYNHSNPDWKWRVRQLTDLTADWERKLPGRRSGMSARDLYLSLHSAPRRGNPNAILKHALRIAAFSRRVFPWAEYRLLSSNLPPLPSSQGGAEGGAGTGRTLPNLDLDVTVRYRHEKFEVLRLNGDGQIFCLSPNEYSLLCLFDGETTKEYALSAAGMTCKESGSEFLEEMLALIRYGDFEAQEILDEKALSTILRIEL